MRLKAQASPPVRGYALSFLLLALIAGGLGFGVIAGTAATIAQALFLVFLVLFVAAVLRGRRSDR